MKERKPNDKGKEASFGAAFVTAPDIDSARALAEALIQRRLAACVSIVPGIESHYRWQGKVERDSEALLIAKTDRRHYRALESCVQSLHPYDVPEIVFLPIEAGSSPYLAWLKSETTLSTKDA